MNMVKEHMLVVNVELIGLGWLRLSSKFLAINFLEKRMKFILSTFPGIQNQLLTLLKIKPAGNYMFKVSNRNPRARCEYIQS